MSDVVAAPAASDSRAGTRREEVDGYLKDLSSFSVVRLEKEPEHLARSLRQVEGEIQRLATENYDSFLAGSKCIAATRHSGTTMFRCLDEVVEQMPVLVKQCEDFERDAQKISNNRQITRLMIQNQYQLLEILEIPQLINSCARVGMYEEALGLEALVQALVARYPSVPILEDIRKQTRTTMEMLKEQLLKMLEGKLQLPICLRVIGYLRRVGAFDEYRLRAQFLQSRDASMARALAAIPEAESPYEYITKYLDISRQYLFEILHQYRAVFIPNVASLDRKFVEQKPESGRTGVRTDESYEKGEDLVSYWVHGHILELLNTVKKAIGEIKETAYIGNILDQCMYVGLSLSRVGLDIRGLVVPLFEERIIEIFKNQLEQEASQMTASLQQHQWHFTQKELKSAGISGNEELSRVLEYPPLAALCNSVIGACNTLRHCAPLAIKKRIGLVVEERLLTSVTELAEAAQAPFLYSDDEKSGEVLLGMIDTFIQSLVPYLHRLLRKLFVCEVQKAEDIMNIKRIIERSVKVRKAQEARVSAAAAEREAELKEKEEEERKARMMEERRTFTREMLHVMEQGLKEGKLPPLERANVQRVFHANQKRGTISKPVLERLINDSIAPPTVTLIYLLREISIETQVENHAKHQDWRKGEIQLNKLHDSICGHPCISVNSKVLKSSLATLSTSSSSPVDTSDQSTRVLKVKDLLDPIGVQTLERILDKPSEFVKKMLRLFNFQSGGQTIDTDNVIGWDGFWDISRIVYYRFSGTVIGEAPHDASEILKEEKNETVTEETEGTRQTEMDKNGEYFSASEYKVVSGAEVPLSDAMENGTEETLTNGNKNGGSHIETKKQAGTAAPPQHKGGKAD